MGNRNPNSMKYFDADKGMTYNNKCPNCETPTWSQESIHTCYEGKHYIKNKSNGDGTYDTVGILHWDSTENGDDDLSGKSGIWCESCYNENFDERGKKKCQS